MKLGSHAPCKLVAAFGVYVATATGDAWLAGVVIAGVE